MHVAHGSRAECQVLPGSRCCGPRAQRASVCRMAIDVQGQVGGGPMATLRCGSIDGLHTTFYCLCYHISPKGNASLALLACHVTGTTLPKQCSLQMSNLTAPSKYIDLAICWPGCSKGAALQLDPLPKGTVYHREHKLCMTLALGGSI